MKNAMFFCLLWCIPVLALAESYNEVCPELTTPLSENILATNDDCFTARLLSLPETYSSTTMGASTDPGAPCAVGGSGLTGDGYYDVWFYFIGTGNEVEISVCHPGTVFDTQLAIYMGSDCFSMSCVAANDDYALDAGCYIGGGAKKSKIIINSILGNKYNIRLDGYSATDIGDYTISAEELIAAPVTLVDFWGEPWERGNTVAWETSSEENVMWHIIERSENGRDNWTEAGKLVSTTTAKDGAIYEIIDVAPFNDTYYRLRTVDYDGSEQISHVISVKRPKAEFQVTKLYPNPVMEEVNMQIDSDRNEEISIRVLDLSGKIVLKYPQEIRDGLNELVLDVQSWKAGIYFIQFHSRQGYITRKIVKQD